MLHNQVNERLGKPEFDCAHLDDEYDCGCGDAPIKKVEDASSGGDVGAGGDKADPMDMEEEEDLGALVRGG